MTLLVPMTPDEFSVFMDEAVPAFAAEKIASGQWTHEEAFDLSRKAFDELLPQGLASPDNFLFSLRDRDGRAGVGWIWIAVQERAGRRIGYVYDVVIAPEHQRKGHATRAFLALEDEVRARGLSGIALHVFGHNAAARALYTKLGYEPTNINLFKSVD